MKFLIMKKLFYIALLLISCSSNKDFSKIKPGMTEKEVVSLVGEPKEKIPMPISIVYWRYTDNENHVIVFEGGKVTTVVTQGDKEEFIQKVDSVKSGHKDSL